MQSTSYITSGFESLIRSRIEQVAAQHDGRPTLILLMGFTPFQLRAATESPCASPSMSSLLSHGGELNLSQVEASKQPLFTEILSLSSPTVLAYEQIIPIRSALKDLYTGDIVVLRNNLFPPNAPLPCAASQTDLKLLATTIDESRSDDNIAGRFYADVIPCGDSLLVSPIKLDQSLTPYTEESLFPSVPFEPKDTAATYQPIPLSSKTLAELCLKLSQGELAEASLIISPGDNTPASCASTLNCLAGIMASLPLPIEILNEIQWGRPNDGARLLPLLRRHWGEKARFRKLRMYANPDSNNKMREYSQGEIADFTVTQSENALRGSEDYRDIFITAPTGAGKSLLFQLPALYLAQEHHAVTLVIEPLIALMRDQVNSLRQRGANNVVAINSDLTYGERQAAYERIGDGSASILYLSPELLLSTSLKDILGNRQIALVVIDEVHTVTSWGQEFRPDYWYLGPYLAKIRKQGMKFPILCMTATAVYGGKDDMVMQTIRDLELISPYVLLGNPRRDDISFDIRQISKSLYAGRIDEVKTRFAVEAIRRFVDKNSHAIIYCPYRKHVNNVMDAVSSISSGNTKVLGFHGGMDKEYKQLVESSFKQRDCLVLVSTKAFGMGIDVDDITDVYHYAPTGNLSDYVQEIGRGARKNNLTATASIDFFHSDSSYANQLYQLSRFFDWQLKDIMEKLYSVYVSKPPEKRSQNLLVSPNSFSYLFPDEADDTKRVNRTKSALMIISKDLEARFGFPVLIVRPKPSFTKCFVCVQRSIENRFLASYGRYMRSVTKGGQHIEHHNGQHDVMVSDMGNIFELRAADMWENAFPQYTFAQFKLKLFKGELLSYSDEGSVSPRIKLEITYRNNPEQVGVWFAAYAAALDSTFKLLARNGFFDKTEFKAEFEKQLGENAPALPHPDLLLKSFVLPIDATSYGRDTSSMKFVRKRSSGKQAGMKQTTAYKLKYSDVLNLEADLKKRFNMVAPDSRGYFTRFINPHSAGRIYETAELLEVLGLASYEAHGGDEPEIFVRLNDPTKLHDLAGDVYFRNRVLRQMTNRRKYASEVITRFFNTEMDDADRWDLIEEYFLGNDGRVAELLGMKNQEEVSSEPKVQYRGSTELFNGPSMTCVQQGTRHEGPFFRLWKELGNSCSSTLEYASIQTLKEAMRGSSYEHPMQSAELMLEGDDEPVRPLLTWDGAHVALFDLKRAADYERASKSDWKCYLLGKEDVKELVDAVRISPMVGSA
ncbi:DEAD/DEAH box helicase [Collinsella intestinalis]|uniref:DEAD/DEAH box helicase n=1 Tax=Collinsella intestinalis TaxID=147207 RepID=UPI0025A4AECD|nr:DEAD/DEAH box helicase [Collinsella intestinalis]MDM8164168.1 DEAD/DEAH box helicase [Collinsella intestinalis]